MFVDDTNTDVCLGFTDMQGTHANRIGKERATYKSEFIIEMLLIGCSS